MSSGPDLAGLRIDDEEKEVSRRRWPIVVVGIVIVAVIALAVRWIVAETGVADVNLVQVRVERSAESAVLNASGYVTPRRRATVSAKITGKLIEVLIEEGFIVEKDQVLARMDSLDADTVLNTARAELDVAGARASELEVELVDANRSLRRVSRLFADGVASQDDLDGAETRVARVEAGIERARREVDASAARVAEARRHVENHVIRAPFAGVVVSKDAQPGEMVSPVSAGGGFTRTGIATIVDMSSLEIEVDVNESYIARVEPGQRVDAVLDAYPAWHIPASVITVIPTADRQKATVRVRIAFDELDPRILPDMGVRVGFLGAETARDENAQRVLVSADAVFERDSGSYVWIINVDRVERRAVTPGMKNGDELEIVGGLSGGEQLVAQPSAQLEDGARVRISDDN
ncbi:MAG: efflux RND transporter periplasmic adaptor subunit [bacterium]|nr:efflux RND transporter periplasmic adaptor subunit [bacterium]